MSYIKKLFGYEVDLSVEGHTACPCKTKGIIHVHGNTKIPDYEKDVRVLSVFQKPRGQNKKIQFLWYVDCTCDHCGQIFEYKEHLYKKLGECLCTSCTKTEFRLGSSVGYLYLLGVRNINNRNHWFCRCICGNLTKKESRQLKGTSSCGCKTPKPLGKERSLPEICNTFDVEYRTYVSMLDRVKPTNKRHKDYSDRGIDVCARWVNSFSNFLEDMGPRPSKLHSLDRIDNMLGYSKENCRWVTSDIQMYNRRSLNNVSGRIGVSVCNTTGRWRARLTYEKISYWLGRFSSYEEACDAIEQKELELSGLSRRDYVDNL